MPSINNKKNSARESDNSTNGNNPYPSELHTDFFVIAGPCVIETRDICLRTAEKLAEAARINDISIYFKASYDKANRTSITAYRGPGKEEGLRILEEVRRQTGLKTLTDIHEVPQVQEAASVVDILQIPAFLCRQTDLLTAAAKSGKTVNIKKGQFLSPAEMAHPVAKVGGNCWVTERGTFFGYNRLVVDFAGISTLKSLGKPVVFDATHSVQQPGGGDGCSSGNREMAIPLAKAAVSVGVNGLFFEIHPDPDNALCDGPNSLQTDYFLDELPKLITLKHFIDEL